MKPKKSQQQEKAKKPEPSSSKAKSSPENQQPKADKETMWSDAGFNESELTLSQLKNMITTLATEIFNKKKEAIKAEVDEEVEARLYDHSNDVEETVEELRKEMELMREENESLKKENTNLRRRTERLEFDITNQNKKLRDLKICSDAVEQQLYEKDLQIVGIPELFDKEGSEDEVDIKTIVKMVHEKMDINLKPNDIEKINRLGKRKNDKTRDIVIRFRRTNVRNKIYNNRKKAATHSDPNKNTYFNDRLTEYRRDLLYAARQLVKRKRILAAWSQQGNVLIRKTDKDSVVQITSHEQLRELNTIPDEIGQSVGDPDTDYDSE